MILYLIDEFLYKIQVFLGYGQKILLDLDAVLVIFRIKNFFNQSFVDGIAAFCMKTNSQTFYNDLLILIVSGQNKIIIQYFIDFHSRSLLINIKRPIIREINAQTIGLA